MNFIWPLSCSFKWLLASHSLTQLVSHNLLPLQTVYNTHSISQSICAYLVARFHYFSWWLFRQDKKNSFNPAINLKETKLSTNFIHSPNPALFKQCILKGQVPDTLFSTWNTKKKKKTLEVALITRDHRTKYKIQLNKGMYKAINKNVINGYVHMVLYIIKAW